MLTLKEESMKTKSREVMKHLKQSANKAALHLCPVMSFSDGVGCCIKLPHNTSLQDHAAHEKYMLPLILHQVPKFSSAFL